MTTEQPSSYKILNKKITKVRRILEELSSNSKQETKEYRAFRRKLSEYDEQLKQTKEFKERRLMEALGGVRAISNHIKHSVCFSISVGEVSLDTIDNVDAGRSFSDSSNHSSGSGTTTSSDESDEGSRDTTSSSSERKEKYKVLVNKYEKVYKLLLDLDNTERSNCCKVYAKNNSKREEYLVELQTHREWKADQNYIEERIQRQLAQKYAQRDAEQAEEQHRLAVKNETKARESELKLAKEEALAKLREFQAARLEQERLNKLMREKTVDEAKHQMQQFNSQMEREVKKRQEELNLSLLEQEKLGIISIQWKHQS